MELVEIIQEEVQKVCFRKVDYAEILIDSGLLDSISLIDLTVALESRLQITVPILDITRENFNSVQLIHEYLDGKLDSSDSE